MADATSLQVPAPALAARDAEPAPKRWDGRSKGGARLFLTCAWLLQRLGLPGAVIGSYIVAVGFLIAGGREQFGTVAYWRRLRPKAGRLVHLLLAYRHFASFGRILCDRMLVALRPDSFSFAYRDGDRIRAAVQSGKGCILLAAHVGNWELAGFRLLKIAKGTVNLVMVHADIPEVQAFVDRHMRDGTDTRVIDPRDPLGASLQIHAALQRGETVCMLGDRVYGQQPWMRVPFLGGTARFPVGPFHAAAITGAPILCCFLVKTGTTSYRLEVDAPFHVRLPRRRKDRAAALERVVARWARRLEAQVRRFPMQWHNFYDFWE